MEQVFPSKELQRQMHAEERKFLADMDSDLQHRQAMAVPYQTDKSCLYVEKFLYFCKKFWIWRE